MFLPLSSLDTDTILRTRVVFSPMQDPHRPAMGHGYAHHTCSGKLLSHYRPHSMACWSICFTRRRGQAVVRERLYLEPPSSRSCTLGDPLTCSR